MVVGGGNDDGDDDGDDEQLCAIVHSGESVFVSICILCVHLAWNFRYFVLILNSIWNRFSCGPKLNCILWCVFQIYDKKMKSLFLCVCLTNDKIKRTARIEPK